MSSGLYVNHQLFSSKLCNNASSCEQQAAFEYAFHVGLGAPPVKRVVPTYILRKLCKLGFVYVVHAQGPLAYRPRVMEQVWVHSV